jgi:hypothetical protein
MGDLGLAYGKGRAIRIPFPFAIIIGVLTTIGIVTIWNLTAQKTI